MTRGAKLWAAWAYLVLVALIGIEVSFLSFNVIYIVPKFQRFVHTGVIDRDKLARAEMSWVPGFLKGLMVVADYSTFLFLGAAALIGLFEWRVRGENKPFVRLSILSTVVLGLTIVVGLMCAAMILSFVVGLPPWAYR